MLLCFSPLILEHFWPASTLLHGHLALAIPSLLETDPQFWSIGVTLMRITWANHFVGGSFSARVPRSSAELHRGFVHHILEDEVDGAQGKTG